MTHRSPLLVALLSALSSACGGPTAPQWPVMVQLRLVNAANEAVFIKAQGEESLYPGVANLAPNDSACTTVNAYADAVPVEVHAVTTPDVIYGSAWIRPLSGTGWRAVVGTDGVTAGRSEACS